MMLVGYAYPSVYVSGNRKRRHEEIRLQLPFVLDLLTLSTEAGLDFIGALQKVVEKTRSGPLVDESNACCSRFNSERPARTRCATWLGGSTFPRPLRSSRCWSPRTRWEARSGRSCGPVGADPVQRFTYAEKKGAAASQKLLFPLIFFIMPAVFIMIFGPVILGFLGGAK